MEVLLYIYVTLACNRTTRKIKNWKVSEHSKTRDHNIIYYEITQEHNKNRGNATENQKKLNIRKADRATFQNSIDEVFKAPCGRDGSKPTIPWGQIS